MIEAATEVDGRQAWTISSRDFTRAKVETTQEIIWKNAPEDTLKHGTAVFQIHIVLQDEIEEWMTSHGFEYKLISDEQGNTGNVLAMFDLGAFLMFKLTWVGS